MASPAAVLNILIAANNLQAKAALTQTQAQLKATGATATATSATMKKAFLGIGLAAGAAGAALFKVGEEFDDAFDKIQTRTGATGREMRKLKGVFRDVVSDVPASFDDAATAVGDLNTRLGLSGKPLKSMAKQVTELSRITDTDLEGNVRSVARAFVDWEVATKDQSDALDGFFRLSQKSGVSVAEIADSIQKFGSPLRNLGFDLEESAAMFANFERAGVNTRTMVPGLKLAIANLVDPTSELADTFEKLGINARKPEDGIRQVFALLSGDNLNQVEKMSLAMEVFGSRAGADMAEAIRQGRFEVDKFIDVMKNGEGTIREQGRRTMDLSEHWTKFKNNLKLAVEPVAKKVFKGLGDLMKEVTTTFKKEGLSGALELLVDKFAAVIPKIAEAAATAGPRIVGALAKGIATAWGEMSPLAKLFTTAAIIRAVGGKGALLAVGGRIGAWLGLGISSGAATAIGGGAAGGAAAGGGIAGALGKIKWARLGGVAIGVALADGALKSFADRTAERSADWRESLESFADMSMGENLKDRLDDLLDLDFGGLFGDASSKEAEAAKELQGILDDLANDTYPRLTDADQARIDDLRTQVALSSEASRALRADLSKIINVDELRRQGDNVRAAFDQAFNMRDILTQFRSNTAEIGANWRKGTTEFRALTQDNFYAARDAIRRAMADGEISLSKGEEAIDRLKMKLDIKGPLDALSNDAKQAFAGVGKAADKASGNVMKATDAMTGDLIRLHQPFSNMEQDARKAFAGASDSADKNGQKIRDANDKTGKSMDEVGDKSRTLNRRGGGNYSSFAAVVGEALRGIGINTNEALKTMGVDKLQFGWQALDGSEKQKFYQSGGVIVPGSGSGDKVPAMLEPGEVVLNRKAVAAMGGANKANAINAMIPRFAGGGVVFPHRNYPMLSGDTDMNPALGTRLSQMAQAANTAISVTSGGRTYAEQVALQGGPNPAAAPGSSHHEFVNGAIAADISPGYERFGGMAGKFGMIFNLLGIGEPWHIELANAASAASGAAAQVVKDIKRVILEGPDGPLKDMGQAALDKVRKAANDFIGKQSPTELPGGGGSFSAGPGALSKPELRSLMGKVGLPDIFGYIAEAESGRNPNAFNPSGASGLWQIMMPLHSALVSQAGGDVFDPLTNAKVASMLSSGGSNLAPWVASQGVWGSHVGQAYQQGGVVGKSGLAAYSQRVWDAAKGFIPSTWDRPDVRNAATPGHWGYWNSEKGLIKIPDAMKKALLDPKNPRHSFAFANLLHEYAHAAQDFGLDRRTQEGGADLWARWIAPKVASAMGESYSGSAMGYPGMAAWVKKNKPASWWQGGIDPDKTQFRQAGGIIQALRKGGKGKPPAWFSPWSPSAPSAYTPDGTQGYIPGPSSGVGVEVSPHYATIPTQISDALFWLGANVTHLEEQISNAETLASFASSELGSALGPNEKAQQVALNDQLLATLLESVTWLNKAIGIRGLPPDTYTELGSSLQAIQGVTGHGGKILGVRSRLDQLAATDTSNTTDTSAELIALLRAQLLSTQRALNVSQAQYGVFAGMKGAGGKIGPGQWGIAGERGPEVVTGPAQVYSNSDSAGMLGTNVRVVIQDQRTRVFVNDQEVRAIVKDETRKMAKGRPLPGVRG